jgi:hypothetical protein
MTLIILIIAISIILIFNIFVYIFWKKIMSLEAVIIELFKKRNNQIVWVYETTKDELVRAKDIFKEFFELKRRDFWEDSFDTELAIKLLTYKKMHNEINFIFETCEKHREIQTNPIYSYFKESIYDKSKIIWEKIGIYNEIKKKFNKYKFVSRVTLIWYFY